MPCPPMDLIWITRITTILSVERNSNRVVARGIVEFAAYVRIGESGIAKDATNASMEFPSLAIHALARSMTNGKKRACKFTQHSRKLPFTFFAILEIC